MVILTGNSPVKGGYFFEIKIVLFQLVLQRYLLCSNFIVGSKYQELVLQKDLKEPEYRLKIKIFYLS